MSEHDGRKRLRAEVAQQFDDLVDGGKIAGNKLPAQEGLELATPVEEATPPTEQATPAEKPAKQPAKAEPQYAGKYKSVPELESGYEHLLKQSGIMSTENAQYREQLASMTATPPNTQATQTPGGSPGMEQRVDPSAKSPVWNTNAAVMKFSESTGLDPSVAGDLAASIYDQAVASVQQSAMQAAQDAVAPIYAQTAADNYMQQNHPEAFKFTDELKTYLETANPQVKATFKNLADAKNFAGASEYAWLSYRQNAGDTAQSQVLAQAKESATEQAQAQANAGVAATSPGTPVHAESQKPDAPTNEEVTELAKRARTGDIHDQKRYREATVGRMLGNDPAFQKMVEKHNREFGLA